TGNVIIPFKYNFAGYFREGLACINIGGGIPKTYDPSTGGFQKYYKEKVIGGKWGFIDKTGKEIVLPKYNYADFFVGGLAPVELNNKWGWIDKTGKEIIPLKYRYPQNSLWFTNSNPKIKVELNGEWFYIDKNGNRVEE
ncbi:MAG: WG repeat-containing protein, partial [Alistipes sp.]|nr:WG repeat-containing protein [Alistipes sp.]